MNLLYLLYNHLLSPVIFAISNLVFGNQHGCRYSPTCSEYSRQAITKYGIIRGGILTIRRIASCHPYSKRPQLDPVP